MRRIAQRARACASSSVASVLRYPSQLIATFSSIDGYPRFLSGNPEMDEAAN